MGAVIVKWAMLVVGALLVAGCGETVQPAVATIVPVASPAAPDQGVEQLGAAEATHPAVHQAGAKGTGAPSGTPAAGSAPAEVARPPSRSSPAGRSTFALARLVVGPAEEASLRPEFSDVARRTPAEVVAYLSGHLPEYPGGGPEALVDFSASDILESTDAAVVDWVGRHHGAEGLRRIYEGIARAVLETLREQYGERWVLVPFDAGHGGKRDVSWEGGAGDTEADHTRGVAAALLRLGQGAAYRRIILRPVYNDAMTDDLGLPKSLDKPSLNRVVVRQARASMLAAEAAAWNRAHPEVERVAVHEIAIHFNAGAGGAMVLHQGETVRPERVAQSVQFARRYLRRVTDELNGTGLLPEPLRLWAGNGLHDDVMMYRPAYLSDQEIGGMTLRYGALQGKGYLTRYVETVVAAQAGRP